MRLFVPRLDFNPKWIKQPSRPTVNWPRDEGYVCFPSLFLQHNAFPQLCFGLFAFKLVFSHYRNLLGQLEFPFSLESVWKLHFLLEGPLRPPPSR